MHIAATYKAQLSRPINYILKEIGNISAWDQHESVAFRQRSWADPDIASLRSKEPPVFKHMVDGHEVRRVIMNYVSSFIIPGTDSLKVYANLIQLRIVDLDKLVNRSG